MQFVLSSSFGWPRSTLFYIELGIEMRLTGTLRSWNDERGFGFIAPAHSDTEVFVHVSAFPRDGTRPTIGERLSYELDRGRDGKPQAVRVIRSDLRASSPHRKRERSSPKSKPNWFGLVVVFAFLGVGGIWGYKHFAQWQHRRDLSAQPISVPVGVSTSSESPSTFRCDGRAYCSQMTSCAEAKWFINNCPGTKMDGNNDGIPCQEQWCQ